MTLIMTLVNSEQVIQISDRRLTVNGILDDDESNKAGLLICRDARFAFGFTGLARFNNFQTRDWLLEAIYNSCSPDYIIGKTLERIRDYASMEFNNNPTLKCLSPRDRILNIMFSGYLTAFQPPLWAYAILTNDLRYRTEKHYNISNNQFIVRCWKEIRPSPEKVPTLVQRVGAYTAVNTKDEDVLRQLLFDLKPSHAIIGKAVDLIREIADRPAARGTIGKQLSIITIPRDTNKLPETGYQSNEIKFESFYPDTVVALCDESRYMAKEPSICSDEPFVFPKVRRNQLCPCGSGKKYKRCHGKFI